MEPSVFIRHNENENTHWCFSARRKILSYIIKKKVTKLENKLKTFLNFINFPFGISILLLGEKKQ